MFNLHGLQKNSSNDLKSNEFALRKKEKNHHDRSLQLPNLNPAKAVTASSLILDPSNEMQIIKNL